MADEAFDPVASGAVAVEPPPQPFDPSQHGAIPVQQPEEPSILQKTGRAVVDTLKGFLPQSLSDVALAPINMIPGFGQAVKPLENIAFGRPASEGVEPFISGVPVVQRIPQIIAAEKTPAGSQERFTAGAGVVADLAMIAGLKSAFHPEIAPEPVATDAAVAETKAAPVAPEVAQPVPEVQPAATSPTLPQETFPSLLQSAEETRRQTLNQGGETSAVQEPSAGEILQREPQETGAPGGERERVEQGVQGQETAQTRPEEVAQTVPQPEQTPATPQEVARNIADSVGGEVVGFAAKVDANPNDIDIRLTEDQGPSALEKLKAQGYEQLDSSIVSPEEARKSGKTFGEGWARSWNLKNPETGQKVQLWHTDEGKLVPEPTSVPSAEAATTAATLPKEEVGIKEPTPATVPTETGETGISSKRFEEAYGDSAPVANTGKGPAAWNEEGMSRLDNFQKTGDARNDPYSVLTNLRTGKTPISQYPSDVALLGAEHQKLLEAARQAEGTPEWGDKSQAALDMGNAIKEVAHGPASDTFRALQDHNAPRYDNVTDFDQALRERENRESTTEEQASFKKMADDVASTKDAAAKEIDKAQKTLGKFPKLPIDDAATSIHDQLSKLTEGCKI